MPTKIKKLPQAGLREFQREMYTYLKASTPLVLLRHRKPAFIIMKYNYTVAKGLASGKVSFFNEDDIEFKSPPSETPQHPEPPLAFEGTVEPKGLEPAIEPTKETDATFLEKTRRLLNKKIF